MSSKFYTYFCVLLNIYVCVVYSLLVTPTSQLLEQELFCDGVYILSNSLWVVGGGVDVFLLLFFVLLLIKLGAF